MPQGGAGGGGRVMGKTFFILNSARDLVWNFVRDRARNLVWNFGRKVESFRFYWGPDNTGLGYFPVPQSGLPPQPDWGIVRYRYRTVGGQSGAGQPVRSRLVSRSLAFKNATEQNTILTFGQNFLWRGEPVTAWTGS